MLLSLNSEGCSLINTYFTRTLWQSTRQLFLGYRVHRWCVLVPLWVWSSRPARLWGRLVVALRQNPLLYEPRYNKVVRILLDDLRPRWQDVHFQGFAWLLMFWTPLCIRFVSWSLLRLIVDNINCLLNRGYANHQITTIKFFFVKKCRHMLWFFDLLKLLLYFLLAATATSQTIKSCGLIRILFIQENTESDLESPCRRDVKEPLPLTLIPDHCGYELLNS